MGASYSCKRATRSAGSAYCTKYIFSSDQFLATVGLSRWKWQPRKRTNGKYLRYSMNIQHGFKKFVESLKKDARTISQRLFLTQGISNCSQMQWSEANGSPRPSWFLAPPGPSPLVRLLRRLSLPAKITSYPSAVMVQSRKQVTLYQDLFHSGRDNEELTHVTYSAVVEPVASTLTANRSLTTAQRHSLHSVESTSHICLGSDGHRIIKSSAPSSGPLLYQ